MARFGIPQSVALWLITGLCGLSGPTAAAEQPTSRSLPIRKGEALARSTLAAVPAECSLVISGAGNQSPEVYEYLADLISADPERFSFIELRAPASASRSVQSAYKHLKAAVAHSGPRRPLHQFASIELRSPETNPSSLSSAAPHATPQEWSAGIFLLPLSEIIEIIPLNPSDTLPWPWQSRAGVYAAIWFFSQTSSTSANLSGLDPDAKRFPATTGISQDLGLQSEIVFESTDSQRFSTEEARHFRSESSQLASQTHLFRISDYFDFYIQANPSERLRTRCQNILSRLKSYFTAAPSTRR